MGQRTEIKSISKVVMNFVRPMTKVVLSVKRWGAIVVTYLTLNSIIRLKISCTNVDFFHQILWHYVPQNNESVIFPHLKLLFTQVDIRRSKMWRWWMWCMSINMAVRKVKNAKKWTEEEKK